MTNRPDRAPGRRSLLLLVPLMAVGLMACGGGTSSGVPGGGGGGGAADPAARAAFVAQADAICAPANARIAGIGKPITEGLLAGAAGDVRSAIDAQVGPLRRLVAPAGDATGQAEATWVALDEVGTSALALQRAAVTHDSEAAGQAMAAMSARYAEASSKAGALGFTACVVGMKPGLDRLTASSSSFPKATYLSKLESICLDATMARIRLEGRPGSLTAYGSRLAQEVQIPEKAVVAMKANPAPPADAAAVAAINSAADRAVAKVRELRDAALADNGAKAKPLATAATSLAKQANAKLVGYGSKICSEMFPT